MLHPVDWVPTYAEPYWSSVSPCLAIIAFAWELVSIAISRHYLDLLDQGRAGKPDGYDTVIFASVDLEHLSLVLRPSSPGFAPCLVSIRADIVAELALMATSVWEKMMRAIMITADAECGAGAIAALHGARERALPSLALETNVGLVSYLNRVNLELYKNRHSL